MTQIEALTLLGVEFDADEREIRTAWRQLAKTHHPDRGGNAQFFIMLTEAYQLLMEGGYTPKPGVRQLTGRVSHSHRRVREPVSAWYWDEQRWLEQEFGHLGYWTRNGKMK